MFELSVPNLYMNFRKTKKTISMQKVRTLLGNKSECEVSSWRGILFIAGWCDKGDIQVPAEHCDRERGSEEEATQPAASHRRPGLHARQTAAGRNQSLRRRSDHPLPLQGKFRHPQP